MVKNVFFLTLMIFWGVNSIQASPTNIEAKLELGKGKVVVVSMDTVAFSSTTPQIAAKRWGCDYDLPNPSARIVSSMNISVNNERIWVPLSAFTDLCDPRQVKITKTKDGFAVTIIGSDAGGAYKAVLKFVGHDIKSRAVSCLELPEIVEKTSYSLRQNPE